VSRLESLNGDSFEAVLGQIDAAALKARVGNLVGAINERVRAGDSLAKLATPSAEVCSFCAARILCPAFKREQDRLGLEGEQYLVEGLVTRLTHSTSGAVVDLTIVDDFRRAVLTIEVPSTVGATIKAGRGYQLSNLRRHGAALEWGHTSRAFSFE
jgi:hypothetical protein